ncbi:MULTISPECIES: hypothetical protein [Bradyrhizobium]|uniref:hypothetical protein n=1 Tax=Bradyrhizobium TaxID=374 RepID=UPI00067EDD71|nr:MULTISPECIES: hypothetical protein [Bradyrhizobium]PAY10769.1 hypothetical protein CK489_00885 [Bradyrhizobium sp. UFLA03-84]
MIDQVKPPAVEQPAKYGTGVGCEKPGDRHRLLDLLEDDEVREAHKHDPALAVSKTEGRPAP